MTSLFFYVAAAGLGAFHALEPGHGKTVVAAYLVGSKGRRIDAVILGIIVTLTHTFSVIILAVVAKVASAKWALEGEALHAYLGLAAGSLILAVGLWMLVARLRGKEPLHFHSHDDGHSHRVNHTHSHNDSWDKEVHLLDHSHGENEDDHPHDHGNTHTHEYNLRHSHAAASEGGGHSQNHNHDTDNRSHGPDRGRSHVHEPHEAHSHGLGSDAAVVDVEGEGNISYWQLSLLGISGGLVPCPAAIAVLLAGVGSGKVGEALSYVLAFSVGLAAALIAIGLGVVTASSLASRFLDAKKFARKVAIVSAAIITLIGLVTILGSLKHLISILTQTVA